MRWVATRPIRVVTRYGFTVLWSPGFTCWRRAVCWLSRVWPRPTLAAVSQELLVLKRAEREVVRILPRQIASRGERATDADERDQPLRDRLAGDRIALTRSISSSPNQHIEGGADDSRDPHRAQPTHRPREEVDGERHCGDGACPLQQHLAPGTVRVEFVQLAEH